MASRSIDLISKNVQHTFSSNQEKIIARAEHFFVFPLPLFYTTTTLFCTTKTSNFLVTHYFYGGIVVCAYPMFCFLCSCSLLFFTAAHFHLAGRQHFSFSHRRFEFPCFSSSKFVSFVFNNSLQPPKKTRLCCCFFLSNSPSGHVISFQIKP